MKNQISAISLCCFLVVVSGCDTGESSDQDNSDLNKNITLNMVVPASLTGGLITNLQASVKLDSGTPQNLTVSPDNTVSGELRGVPVGTHTLLISYYVTDVVLATFTTTVSVAKDQTSSVTIADGDLNRDIDNDGDGYTNLAEVRMGYDANLSSDKPPTESPNFTVGNGSFGEIASTSFDVNAKIGEPINGTATSTNFEITSGFGAY